jgi:hypothetical protein
MRNNIDKGGVGGEAPKNEKDNPVVQQFNVFWDLYDKKSCNYPGTLKIWMQLSEADREAALAFVGNYLRMEPTRKYRKAPANYLHERLWESEDLPDHSTVRGRKGDNEGAEMPQNLTRGDETGDLSVEGEKRGQKPQKGQKRATVADNPPTLEEVQAYFDERTQQGKPFLYITPEGFYDACLQSGWALKDGKPMLDWKARVRTFEGYRKEHGDRPVGVARQQTQQRSDDSPKRVDGDNFDGMETW